MAVNLCKPPLPCSPLSSNKKGCSRTIKYKKDAERKFVQGMPVFVSDEEAVWKDGSVNTVVDGSNLLEIQCSDGQIKHVEEVKLLLRGENVQYACTEQLSSLVPLHQASVLQCLRRRFHGNSFYTYAGSTLIAANPFTEIPYLYGTEVIQRYHGTSQRKDLAPHVYSIAGDAYCNMTSANDGSANQSVIISGESGAGKTVTARHIMRYLTSVSNADVVCETTGRKIESKILNSNPLLEAFGNASTVRNHNSSRFGKYIQLQFQRNGQIVGANLITYLLEKTRVTHHNNFEHNFHVFYQLLNGASKQERNQCLLVTEKEYLLADLTGRNTSHDREMWNYTKNAMQDIGIGEEDQMNVIKILAAILHLGNLHLLVDEDDDSICVIDQDDESSAESLECACTLLGLDPSKLESTITHRQITASHARRKSIFHHPCSIQESFTRKDCLTKLLYSRLFEWLVSYVNEQIHAEDPSCSTIGILDIYGFEHFQENSLEQLCINYANEKLQQHFVTHFFKDLQAEYLEEAIAWTVTDYEDNRPCLDLLEAKPGIFSLIDEECHLNRPVDVFVISNRLQTTLQSSKHLKPGHRNHNAPSFTIKHYASSVTYSLDKMIEKNKDNIPPELVELLKKCDRTFISELFSDSQIDQPGKRKKTVLSKFKVSLDDLMTSLQQTQPHYIRCIKPNSHSQGGLFDAAYVMSQLTACGVIETVQISRQLYPVKFSYDEFLQRYGIILKGLTASRLRHYASSQSDDDKENDNLFDPLEAMYKSQLRMTPTRRTTTPKHRLRRRAGLSSIDHTRRLVAATLKEVYSHHLHSARYISPTCQQFGRSKIFLKDGQFEQLELKRTEVLTHYSLTIQCAWRRYQVRKQRRMQHSARAIQAAYRGWMNRKNYHKKKRAAQTIQAWFRRQQSKVCKKQQCDPVITASSKTSPDHSTESTSIPRDSIRKKETTERFIDTNSNCETSIKSLIVKNGLNAMKALTSVVRDMQDMSLLAAAFPGIVYLEASQGIVSKRRLPRVPIKFHTKVNSVLKYAHCTPRKEMQCSLTDCLSGYD